MSCRFRGTLMPRSTASRCPALDLAVAAAAVRARPAPRATLTLRISTSTAAITYIYGCNTFRAARSTRDAAWRKTMSSAFAGAAQWGGSNPIYYNPAHACDKPGTIASTIGWASVHPPDWELQVSGTANTLKHCIALPCAGPRRGCRRDARAPSTQGNAHTAHIIEYGGNHLHSWVPHYPRSPQHPRRSVSQNHEQCVRRSCAVGRLKPNLLQPCPCT